VNGFGQLGSALPYRERVDGEFLLVMMKGQLEAVSESRLKREASSAWSLVAFYIRHAVDIEFIGAEPGRCAYELFWHGGRRQR